MRLLAVSLCFLTGCATCCGGAFKKRNPNAKWGSEIGVGTSIFVDAPSKKHPEMVEAVNLSFKITRNW